MSDIRQSPQFASLMKDLGWIIESVSGYKVYLRKFPIIGYFAKMPRPQFPIDIPKLVKFFKYDQSLRIFKFKIAPFVFEDDPNARQYRNELLSAGLKTENEPFNPTTTILIDLTLPDQKMFDNFSEAKRRGVRRALKNNIIVSVSDDFQSFIEIRKKQYSPMGFMVVSEMKALWNNFFPGNAKLLLAYSDNIPLAGILLLFYKNIAYYWYASSLPSGKKLFAPTLLVWEALKLSKKLGCKLFDFEGIYDGRFPKAAESWKGFTKFKEGFGGERKILIENFTT